MEERRDERFKERRKLHQTRLWTAVDEMLKSPNGRYFLRWLVEMTGTLEAAYPLDHARAAFREGERAVGCAVFALVLERGGADKILLEEIKHV